MRGSLDDTDERALVEGFLAKDERASARLIACLIPLLRSEIGRRWPRFIRLIDDVAAEALLTMVRWRETGKIRPDESLDALAARLVNCSAIVERKRQNRLRERETHMEFEAEDPGAGALEQLLSQELAQRLWALVHRLKPRQQEALQAKLKEPPPMAEALGMATAPARLLLFRARAALLDLAIEAGIELPATFLPAEGTHG